MKVVLKYLIQCIDVECQHEELASLSSKEVPHESTSLLGLLCVAVILVDLAERRHGVRAPQLLMEDCRWMQVFSTVGNRIDIEG